MSKVAGYGLPTSEREIREASSWLLCVCELTNVLCLQPLLSTNGSGSIYSVHAVLYEEARVLWLLCILTRKKNLFLSSRPSLSPHQENTPALLL